jgi:hypothetical protein
MRRRSQRLEIGVKTDLLKQLQARDQAIGLGA